MAEPRVFLKENRGRIEENYLEQAKNLPRVFAPVDEKLQKCTKAVSYTHLIPFERWYSVE